MVPLKFAPFSTSTKTTQETRNDSSTEKIVTLCAPWRVIQRPPRPATMAPRSGAKAAMTASCFILAFALSSFQRIQVFDVDAADVAEQHHQDRKADRRLRRRHREDEEHEHLPGDVAEEVGEGDEVEIHREQHQFDRHQEHDQVAAVEEDPDHADREQDRGQHQVVGELEASHSFSAGIETRRTRSSLLALTCMDGSCARVSFRRRSVSAIAAIIATSRITAATSKAYA